MESHSEEAFVRCFSRERHRIYRYIFTLVPSEADAEDIFQQASITLWKKFPEFDRSREFFPWACGVAYKTVQNYRRTARRRNLVLGDEVVQRLAEEQMASPARELRRVELIKECLANLKQRDHDLIVAVYRNGAQAAEVAERLGQATQIIYNRLHSVRRLLLECVNRKSRAC